MRGLALAVLLASISGCITGEEAKRDDSCLHGSIDLMWFDPDHWATWRARALELGGSITPAGAGVDWGAWPGTRLVGWSVPMPDSEQWAKITLTEASDEATFRLSVPAATEPLTPAQQDAWRSHVKHILIDMPRWPATPGTDQAKLDAADHVDRTYIPGEANDRLGSGVFYHDGQRYETRMAWQDHLNDVAAPSPASWAPQVPKGYEFNAAYADTFRAGDVQIHVTSAHAQFEVRAPEYGGWGYGKVTVTGAGVAIAAPGWDPNLDDDAINIRAKSEGDHWGFQGVMAGLDEYDLPTPARQHVWMNTPDGTCFDDTHAAPYEAWRATFL